MYSLRARLERRAHHLLDGTAGLDRDCFIGLSNVKRKPVGLRIHHGRTDPHAPQRRLDATPDGATARYEDSSEHAHSCSSRIKTSWIKTWIGRTLVFGNTLPLLTTCQEKVVPVAVGGGPQPGAAMNLGIVCQSERKFDRRKFLLCP
jgi:hypothetical protein